MPYVIEEVKGAKLKDAAMLPVPFGPGFDAATVAKADRLVITGSSFSDPGPDYCLFELFKGEDKQPVATRRVGGY